MDHDVAALKRLIEKKQAQNPRATHLQIESVEFRLVETLIRAYERDNGVVL